MVVKGAGLVKNRNPLSSKMTKIYYGIGDIHGMYPMLKKLVTAIEADID